MNDIYECGVISREQYAQRADGQWFQRYQNAGPRGYRWGAWKACSDKPEKAGLNRYAGNARLPKN